MAKTNQTLHRLSRVKSPEYEIDSIKRSHQLGERRAYDILMEAQYAWASMDKFRKERERNKRYAYGEQWKDSIMIDGEVMTEEEYIGRQESVPLKTNLIRRLVRSVLGIYRTQDKQPVCTAFDRDEQQLSETMTTVLQCNMQLNRRKELDARSLEEFVISGLVAHRKWFGWRNNKLDCWTDIVPPNSFFIDPNMRDLRGWDIGLIGQVHDFSFKGLVSKFAKSPADHRRLVELYGYARNRDYIITSCEQFGYSSLRNYDFFLTEDPNRCRVIEVWRKETRPRFRCHDYNNGEIFKCEISDKAILVDAENKDRIQRGAALGISEEDIPLITAEWYVDELWYYYFITPTGHILEEGETPYAHKGHPYVFKPYPFIDGEIHSFVNDVIDQQRYVNRLITLYDWIMRASAKGVLLFPAECLPEGMSMEDIADEWSRFNGVIAIKAKPGCALPQQIASNSTNIGISELLNLQIKQMEDISGITGSLQGKTEYAGMSAAMFNQQTQNATIGQADLLECFGDFIREGAIKDVKNIQQCYDSKKIVNISGRNAQLVYDPDKINDIDFDLNFTEFTATPAYRTVMNDFLMELWKNGAISVEMMLEHGSFPFADALLQSLKAQQEQMEQGQMPQGLSSDVRQQLDAEANPQAMQMLQQYASEPSA